MVINFMDDTATIYVLCIVMDVNIVIVVKCSEKKSSDIYILHIKDG